MTYSVKRLDHRELRRMRDKMDLKYGLKPKKNKYGVVIARGFTRRSYRRYNGILYHSALEAHYAAELDLRVRAGELRSWERQVPIELRVNGFLIGTYHIDFVLTYQDRTKEYLEVKGLELPEWRMKWALFEALYGKRFARKGWKMTVVK